MWKEIILENDMSQLTLLEEFLESCRVDWQLEDRVMQHLHLALEEAVSNAIFYAYPGESGKPIELSIYKKTERLEIFLQDGGMPFDPTARPDPDLKVPIEEHKIGGLGIFLIRQLMDRIEYKREDGKNVLRMEMALKTIAFT